MSSQPRRSARIIQNEQKERDASRLRTSLHPEPPPDSSPPPASLATLPNSYFLDLPAELRNVVYDLLWQARNRVAARHKPSRSGILAYYDGMVLDESDLHSVEALCGSYEDKMWRPGPRAGLPKWLLVNKQILAEGLAQFRLKASWNLWRLEPRDDDISIRANMKPEDFLMSPRHAKKICIARMLIENQGADRFQTWFRYGGVVRFILRTDDYRWLNRVIEALGDLPKIESLRIAIGCPYLDFSLKRKIMNKDNPFRLCMELPRPYGALIRTCTSLDRLEVEVFQYNECTWSDEILDYEFVAKVRPVIKSIMKGSVSEMVTSTANPLFNGDGFKRRFGDRQILDHVLIYKRETVKAHERGSGCSP